MSTSMDNSSMEQTAAAPATQPGPTMIGRPLDNCPGCGSWQLSPVVDVDAATVHFLCGSCNRCWHVELGFVRRVQPETCGGCAQSERCLAAYATDRASA